MAVSRGMQSRLDKINILVGQGYTLKKTSLGWIDFRSSSGSPVNIFGFAPPAGFSWIGFLFPFVVCTQIKEWSYFYNAAAIFAISSLISGLSGANLDSAATATVAILYGYMFPYLRKISLDSQLEENTKLYSIFVGLLFSALAATPSIFIDAFFGRI